VIGWHFCHRIESWIDIGLDDESVYLWSGAALSESGLPNANRAPLYSLWYYLLSLLQPNRIALYYLNYKVLTIVPWASLYILLRVGHVSAPLSMATAGLLLMSAGNLPVWPKVSHFALFVVLLTLVTARSPKSRMVALAVAAVGGLLVAYIRPEFVLSFLALIVLLVFVGVGSVRSREPDRAGWIAVGCMICICAAMLLLIGIPGAGKDPRSLYAFAQHFSLNWITWNQSDLSPWTDWKPIVRESFGVIRNPMDALAANPKLFLKHALANVSQIPSTLFRVCTRPAGHFYQVIPSWNLDASRALLLLVGLFLAARNRPFMSLRHRFRNIGRVFLFSAVFAGVALGAMAVVYPRHHYAMMFGVLLVLQTIMVMFGSEANSSRRYPMYIILLIAASFIVVSVKPPSRGKENVRVIHFIQSLGIQDRINLLDADGGYHIYLSGDFHRVPPYLKSTDFDAFLDEYQVNMIVLSSKLRADSRFRGDSSWRKFLRTHRQKGFINLAIPGTKRALLLSHELLRNRGIQRQIQESNGRNHL
jgi:hypothetical protein